MKESKGQKVYRVLVVMLDGDPDDFKQVVSLVVALSAHPISLIFIGVGQSPFSELQRFTRKHLWDEDFAVNLRDHVSFVRFADLK